MHRTIEDPYQPLYAYSVASIGNLLLCLKPHVLRHIRDNLVERQPDFTPPEMPGAIELVQHIEELLMSLDGEA